MPQLDIYGVNFMDLDPKVELEKREAYAYEKREGGPYCVRIEPDMP